jgi:hypothetical protein
MSSSVRVAAVLATALGVACGTGARSDQAPEPVAVATPRPGSTPARAVPSSPAATPSAYCALGIEPGCGCDALAALTSVPDGHTPAELVLAAERYATVVPDAFQPSSRSEVTDLPGPGRRAATKPAPARVIDAPVCVAPVGGKVYCRVGVDGGTVPALPYALADIEACGRDACATLRFSLARTCPRAGGGVTAWAELTGLTELWGQAGPPVRGATR